MAKKASDNIPSVSLEKKSLPKGSGTETQYASKSVLGKISAGGPTRAPQYTLENQKCK